MRAAQQQVPHTDHVEAELLVEIARPVLGQRLEEDHVVRRACVVGHGLDERPAEPPPAHGREGIDVLDLRDAVRLPELAVADHLVAGEDAEVANRHRPGDALQPAIEVRRQLSRAPRLRADELLAQRLDLAEAHLAHRLDRHAAVGLALPSHDQVRRRLPAVCGERRGRSGLVGRQRHLAVPEHLHRGVGRRSDLARARGLLDPDEIEVVDVGQCVAEEGGAEAERDRPFGGTVLEGAPKGVDAIQHERSL